ncbi:pilus assembly protein TadG-related protein [Tabrizicola sp. J26]|uniref:pilus assembly protein TadG-related protein n=1 Tax=Alitabrizicola rongguiensis TaxID=2909234 RepID=UPI001F222491|nr:pilus assembly protein TadG-related protein [Tabrizicola rongguiensis]MCF1708404.1 pilus assembly protein TadG-related protein [Tabrizicola rongguiensis]
MPVFPSKLLTFARDEKGSVTAFSLFMTVACLALAGYAIDIGNLVTARTRLQVAADATAHAALLQRELHTEADAKTKALEVAALNMPESVYGKVLTADDIDFGTWDPDTRTFTPKSGSRSAVQVSTQRNHAYENQIPTYFLKLVGLDDWDVVTSSVFVTYYPTCLREGFVAQDYVDLQSNNSYSNGFCIHSNNYVSLNSNNYFEPGTVVSMPDLDDLELPNSGYKTNVGLEAALREGSWNIRIVQRINAIITGIKNRDPMYLPSYITNATTKTFTKNTVYQTDVTSGTLYTYTCNKGNNTLTIKNSVKLSKVAIITSCDVKFEQGVILEDVVIGTTSTTKNTSITSASGVQIGKDDHCAAGGGAQLLTMGDISFPSDLKMFGGQLLAKGNIEFAANANGIEGAAMVAGGSISGTSNMNMAFCGTGMEANYEAEYFKLAL